MFTSQTPLTIGHLDVAQWVVQFPNTYKVVGSKVQWHVNSSADSGQWLCSSGVHQSGWNFLVFFFLTKRNNKKTENSDSPQLGLPVLWHQGAADSSVCLRTQVWTEQHLCTHTHSRRTEREDDKGTRRRGQEQSRTEGDLSNFCKIGSVHMERERMFSPKRTVITGGKLGAVAQHWHLKDKTRNETYEIYLD